MNRSISCQPAWVAISKAGCCEPAVLVFVGDQLTAVVTHLGVSVSEDLRGHWHLEIGFGPCQTVDPPIWADLGDARAWVETRWQAVGPVRHGEVLTP